MLVEAELGAPAAPRGADPSPTPPQKSFVPGNRSENVAALEPMPPVGVGEYDSVTVRQDINRERAERRAAYRGRWWFPLLVLLVAMSGCWGLLKADQLIADKLIWPTRGAQFVEVGPVPDDPDGTGGRVMIVVGGLNRKSGTGAAAALMPALTLGHTRVFSLIYGSGINDQDIVDKFDALMAKYQPQEVSFFGSSMGGDVVLNLAAHAQDRRNAYREDLLSLAAVDLAASADTDAGAAGQAGATNSGAGAAGQAGANGQVGTNSSTGDGSDAGRHRVVGSQVERAIRLVRIVDAQAAAAAGTAGAAIITGRTPPSVSSGAADAGASPVVPPRLGIIFLDCSPLGVDDVRDVSRTQADVLTGVTEALHTDGGVAARLSAELLAQQSQWSTGRFPVLQVRPDDLAYKFDQVWREKIGAPGISTQLIKDQYGVIRRLDIDDVADALGPGTRIVYFLPENRADDHTVRVDQVESRLHALEIDHQLDLRIVEIPGGHHASAESNADAYRAAIGTFSGTGT